jgi:bifunctional UDP-N-acetylglucosamine pyrophosphorylase / glucosamine-1-phosphate N-acetyltransferase
LSLQSFRLFVFPSSLPLSVLRGLILAPFFFLKIIYNKEIQRFKKRNELRKNMRVNDKLQTIILAAGKSVRFNSKRSKLVHKLLGKTIMERILDSAKATKPERIIVVVGDNWAELEPYLNHPEIYLLQQKEPLGTGHALLQCKEIVDTKNPVLVMNADTPLLRSESLVQFLSQCEIADNALNLLTVSVREPAGYGRIIRNYRNEVIAIKEEAECTDEEKNIKEINAGFYLFSDGKIFSYLEQIGCNNAKGEYYLTDAIKMAVEQGDRIMGICSIEEAEAYGINSRADFARAERILRRRKAEQLMRDGVTIMDEETCYVHENVVIGRDTILYPGVIIEGDSQVGEDCVINSWVRIKDTRMGSRVMVFDHTVIESAVIEDEVRIGPFARIRPETRIGEGAKIGNFVELKKTTLGKYSKANHLSYLGDATIGEKANIGAGTITCNYDGYKKYQTIIGDEVFVGSDTQFVAPVTIGKGAYIAAGSTITKDVPENALGVARGRQENKLDWVKKKKKIKE